MIEEKYLTYQKFNDQAAAVELAELFKENGLEFSLEDDSLNFDATFSYSELNKEFSVKLKREDFKVADKILHEASLKAIDQIGDDYYLFQFSDEELIELIQKSDEWSSFDVVLAEKILKKRGREIKPYALAEFRSARIEELAKPYTINPFLLVFFYLLTLLGGIFAIFIGWYIAYQKKTLPNGKSEYIYASRYRNHGILIMILGCISLLITFVLKIYNAV
jgi:hypothetical protein